MSARLFKILIIVACTSLPVLATKHHGHVLLLKSTWVLVFDDMRVLFHGGMISDDFFDQLERRETAEGTRFFLNSTPVSNYPEKITVQLFGSTWKDGQTPLDKRYSGKASELMDALQFKAEWKRGLATRPATITLTRPPTAQTESNVLWRYELLVSCEQVPLTDHLLISVFGRDSQLVARFSGAP